MSDDGRYQLVVIGFVGSVFSPYYSWSARQDPQDHCAINVALYGPRAGLRGGTNRWAMTERGRASLSRDAQSFAVGPSAMRCDGQGLTIEIDERCFPLPHRLRGTIRLRWDAMNRQSFCLEERGRHVWQPLAPNARVEVEMRDPALRWSGHGYFDRNCGDESLAKAFKTWTWSRARLANGSAILYDADRTRDAPLSLALHVDAAGTCRPVEAPPRVALPRTGWRLARETRTQDDARVVASLEDTPFYARALVENRILGERVTGMHESLSLARFASPVVRLMLPFRMPRRA